MTSDNEQKEIIITAAARLFARFGLEKTTMDDIAKASKKKKSSLYYYFTNKEEVFAEVIGREILGLKNTIIEAVEKEDDPCSKFKNLLQARLKYLQEKADQYTTIKDDYLTHYKFINTLTAAYSNWKISMIRQILKEGQEKHVFEVSDLDTTARSLFFALKTLEYPWTIDLPREEVEKSIELLINILLKGISR
ncbi:MAG: TetR/AcrR family transcriptional regulator [Candidatus Delongbacteria bacterium]|nr:TetR/AcrR family transcriptional regulator [Candidatus Delongbacteria bacterium]